MNGGPDASFFAVLLVACRVHRTHTEPARSRRSWDHLDVFVNGPDGNIASSWWHQGVGWSEFALPF